MPPVRAAKICGPISCGYVKNLKKNTALDSQPRDPENPENPDFSGFSDIENPEKILRIQRSRIYASEMHRSESPNW